MLHIPHPNPLLKEREHSTILLLWYTPLLLKEKGLGVEVNKKSPTKMWSFIYRI